MEPPTREAPTKSHHPRDRQWTLFVAVLAFLAALALGDFLDLGLSMFLGTSQDAVSGATILAAAIAFAAVFVKYIDLMVERDRNLSQLRDEIEAARDGIAKGLDVAAKIRGSRGDSADTLPKFTAV